MQITLTDRYLEELEQILFFIAEDNIEAALRFHDSLEAKIEAIPSMPYKCRQSIKADDERVRDLIFQGYVIPYRVKDECIEVLGIFGENEWEA